MQHLRLPTIVLFAGLPLLCTIFPLLLFYLDRLFLLRGLPDRKSFATLPDRPYSYRILNEILEVRHRSLWVKHALDRCQLILPNQCGAMESLAMMAYLKCYTLGDCFL